MIRAPATYGDNFAAPEQLLATSKYYKPHASAEASETEQLKERIITAIRPLHVAPGGRP